MSRRQLPHHCRDSRSCTSSSRNEASDDTYSTASSPNSGFSPLKDYPHSPSMQLDRYQAVEEPPKLKDAGSFCSSFESVNAYALTASSHEDPRNEPAYLLPFERHEVYASDATPSSPADFEQLFPSNRRLRIHHDDSTSDGNMNLRVDTEIAGSSGRNRKLTLFHLRMHDLKERRFSLRRYCRESGREICSTNRKHRATVPVMPTRPSIQPASGRDPRPLCLSDGERAWMKKSSNRRDSGYGSNDDDDCPSIPRVCQSPKAIHSPPATIQLDFYNSAQINFEKLGSKRSKRYEYNFRGIKYEWRRHVNREGQHQEVSYYLIGGKTSKPIAHITPDQLTAREMEEEEDLGSWVPPCTMRITDRNVFRGLMDVADTVIATGLLALVDDCIDRRWHSQRIFHLELPVHEMAEGLGPERLIDEIFNRSAHTSHQTYRLH